MPVTLEELEKRAASVRLGGKGTIRRTVKAAHKNIGDDKKIQASVKKLGVSPMPDVEEVTMLHTDGSAYVFSQPKVQVSMKSQCFVVSGRYETKSSAEMLPTIVGDLKRIFEKRQLHHPQQQAVAGGAQ